MHTKLVNTSYKFNCMFVSYYTHLQILNAYIKNFLNYSTLHKLIINTLHKIQVFIQTIIHTYKCININGSFLLTVLIKQIIALVDQTKQLKIHTL